jgi:glycosyltransferase involved in cell wall biosynthesis
MNIPSFHQNDLFNQLSTKYDEFEVVFAHSSDEEREKQGWKFNFKTNYNFKIINEDLSIFGLVKYVFKNRNSVHIINGIWAEKSFFWVILLFNFFNANFLIYSEAPIPIKTRTFTKQILLKFLIKPLSKFLIIKAKGVLAVGISGVDYFQSLGVNKDKIYRYGYFRNIPAINKIRIKNQKIELIFVGQLIDLKGIKYLFEAINNISQRIQNFHLTVIGMGKLAPYLATFIENNQIQQLITLQGVVSSESVTEYISNADLLILPSFFDGWGMVVNEALQCQVPVLISDQCGAKELIRHQFNGLIFEAKSIESLQENLLKFINFPIDKREFMKNETEKIAEKISVLSATNYLNLCIQHALNPNSLKPTAPWLND